VRNKKSEASTLEIPAAELRPGDVILTPDSKGRVSRTVIADGLVVVHMWSRVPGETGHQLCMPDDRHLTISSQRRKWGK
jgi:hypothetical protein